jgi:catechol 2,3-dioxygenase-like lactoylglutathione lyase family enzyme
VVADLQRSAKFYRAIGFAVSDAALIPATEMKLLGLSGSGWRSVMSLGNSRVDVDCFEKIGRDYPNGASACDLIFQHLALVTDDAAAAWQLARQAGAAPISRECPVTLPESAGGVTAVKFRDIDGHPLEFLQFPPGANRAWRGTGIMGIDHSAISVADLAASTRFYRRLGLSEADESLNSGPAQTALDGLDDVRVQVVAMRSEAEPPHIELLDYRHPAGRAHSPLAANDVAATRVVWQSDHDTLTCDPDGHLHQFSR